MAEHTIDFLDQLRPALPSGTYQISVEQTISGAPTPYTTTRDITVSGHRFALPPDEVRSVYPPEGSAGNYTGVLPHVILNRATLPWERSPGTGVTGPWLVPLVFSGADIPEPRVTTIGALTNLTREPHQKPDDKMTVIDVPPDVLRRVMPGPKDLCYLAHVRHADGRDVAVVVAAGLPAPNTQATVHLVSVEDRFTTAGFDYGSGTGPIQLVSLASWRFTCNDGPHDFGALAARLGQGEFRMPVVGETTADDLLARGLVPLPHHLRLGGRAVSWYRGPFATGPVDLPPPSAVSGADQLLRYLPRTGMLEVGYAAAWQLGRLLILRSPEVATALVDWKRRRRQRAAQPSIPVPLPDNPADEPPPAIVSEWFTQLSKLHDVPFVYLVPHERLLPAESIRFFHVDRLWVRHLLGGAYGIGDDESDPHPPALPQLTGVLIRSELVSGHPDLIVQATGPDGASLDVFRSGTLSPDVWMGLFVGDLTELELRRPSASLHFGVRLPTNGTVTKQLRRRPGPTQVHLRLPANRLIAGAVAGELASALGVPLADFGSAAFAAEMIEADGTVSFSRSVRRSPA